MGSRRGEKIGWIGGWLGGFLWVLVLAVMFLFQGRGNEGIVGLALAGLAVFYVFSCAPWRSPETPYWRLMIRLYAVLLAAAAWAVWSFGGWRAGGMSYWQLLSWWPVFIPLFTLGRRTWKKNEEREEH